MSQSNVSRQGVSRQGIITNRPNSCMSCPMLPKCQSIEWALKNCGIHDDDQVRMEEAPRERPSFATVLYFTPDVARVAAANTPGGFDADIDESIASFDAQLTHAYNDPIRVGHLPQAEPIRIETPSGRPRDELRIFDTFVDLLATPDLWVSTRPQVEIG